MFRAFLLSTLIGVMSLISAQSSHSEILKVTIKIENLAPDNGNFLTPVWVGFHNGIFDILDINSPASPGLERLAEDGNTSVIAEEFLNSGYGTVEATLPGPNGPIAPGDVFTADIEIDTEDPNSGWFSYASMVIPSNDAFIANRYSKKHPVFRNGKFALRDFFIVGRQVLDAGTEVNDEIPENTAFFGQSTPDTGEIEGGVVVSHEGFDSSIANGILASEDFEAADFREVGYPIAKFSFSAAEVVPVSTVFTAELSGAQEVPPIETPASGSAIIELVENGTVLEYDIMVSDLNNVVAAHFHQAPAGSNGGIVAFLIDPLPAGGGLFAGPISGQITADDLINALDGQPLNALIEEIQAGNIYINIHTSDGLPEDNGPGDIASGELRGQVLSPSE